MQPDGKIVLAGFDELHEFAVWRLNPDGSLDRSFDGDGTVAISFGCSGSRINAAALQPDGKIVVAGGTYAAQTRLDMAVARLNPNGSLDKTFDPGGPDGDGKKVFSAENDTTPRRWPCRRDGRILLAGAARASARSPSRAWTRTARVDGTVFEDPAGFRYEIAADVALQPDGTIVVAGEAIRSWNSDYVPVVARYTPEGALDKTFAGTGITAFAGVHPVELLVRPSGAFVVAGNAGEPDWRMAVRQLTPGGGRRHGVRRRAERPRPTSTARTRQRGRAPARRQGRDRGRGERRERVRGRAVRRERGARPGLRVGREDHGRVRRDRDQGSAAALQPDGRLVVAGVTATGNVTRLAVARLSGRPAAGDQRRPGATPSAPRCAGRRATIVGTRGRDRSAARARADVIAALGGNDRCSRAAATTSSAAAPATTG